MRRRRVLASIGGATLASIAGCSLLSAPAPAPTPRDIPETAVGTEMTVRGTVVHVAAQRDSRNRLGGEFTIADRGDISLSCAVTARIDTKRTQEQQDAFAALHSGSDVRLRGIVAAHDVRDAQGPPCTAGTRIGRIDIDSAEIH